MKKLYFLLFLVFSFIANAQIVNIPDAWFKDVLLSASPSLNIASIETPVYNAATLSLEVTSYHTVDTNGDGEIQISEAQAIKYLKISGNSLSLYDLTGIEAFTNLESFVCNSSQLSSLDFTQNVNLVGFKLTNNNQLSSLDVSQNVNLVHLYCNSSQLTSLDVSQNVNLVDLYCTGSQLTSLDVSQNVNLQTLWCSTNQLTSLDVSSCTNLNSLTCYSNQLTSLDVSQNVNLDHLSCGANQLSSLDVSQNVNLEFLSCYENQISSLNVTGAMNLDRLHCYDNQLSSLDVSQNVNLQTLWCYNNQLTSLDVTGCLNLNSLSCYSNQLTSLDVTGCPNLNSLSCYSNQLTSLNLKNNGTNLGTLSFINNPNIQYICADEEDLALVQQRIDSYGYNSTCHVNSYCFFTPGGTYYETSGNTKLDSNNNGCDVLDINYPNLKFNINNGTNLGNIIANTTGEYYIPVEAGNHTITPILENPTYFNISPNNFTVNFPTQASPFTQDFCVTANGVHSDVEVMVIPTTPARPGFDANYKIVYRNKGNQVENGIVSLAYDDAILDYISSNPVYDSSATNSLTNSLTWNYTNLQPFETREIEISFNVNSPTDTPPVNNNDFLLYFAFISPSGTDEYVYDNNFVLSQRVVGSYDPNDKICLEGDTVDITTVGKYVHYVIRFENTGTYPAENIVVKDVINTSKFDISTLVPLHGSHEFFTRINGNKVEFIFENINLDFNDATNDGYVVFKIKTLPTLNIGDTFSNNANIYFDYNFPITTNTYNTTINNVLNNQDFVFENEFVLYPNPARDILNISSKNQTEIQSVEIYNMVGQVVIAIPNSTKSIDVSNLETGTYFIKVNIQKGSSTTKFVKE